MRHSGLFRNRRPLGLLLATFLAGTASPDEIYLTSGGQLSGRIVSRTDKAVEVDVGAGRITVPASSVVRIEEGRSALQEYEERARALAPGDAAGWLELGEWASSRGLGTQAREAYARVLQMVPNDPRANAALGRVEVDGRFLSEDDAYRARGYVKHDGEWMTPAEQEAILRSEQEHHEAESRVREAEARADEAEARAREAEQKAAEAEQASEGIPAWYGWGGGPVIWPTRPVVAPPVNRPVARPVRSR